MKRLKIGSLLTVLMAVIINQSALLMMNPFGIAYFAAGYMYEDGRIFLFLFSLLGLLLALPVKVALKYVCIICGIMIVEKVLRMNHHKLSLGGMAGVTGFFTLISGIAYSIGINIGASIQLGSICLINALEALVIFCLVFIFYKGVNVIRGNTISEILDTKVQLSVGILLAVNLYAINRSAAQGYSILEALIFFILFYFGYCYGSASSAMIGACIGIGLAMIQGNMEVMGCICILAIVSGAFRAYGRMIQTLLVCGTCVIFYYLGVEYIASIVTVRGLIAGSIVYLLIPEKILHSVSDEVLKKIKIENPNFDQNKMVQQKLKNFSQTFRNLSKTFCESIHPETELTEDDVENAFGEVTQNLCMKCNRCEFCWEREYSETYQATNQILKYCSLYGPMESGHVPMPFKHRCVNLNQFLDETSRAIEMAKVNMNWHNRLMESRLAVAGQFSGVADMIDDLSDSLNLKDENNDDWANRIRKRLSGRKMRIKNVSVVTGANKPIKVYIQGRMQHGRYVTAKEICSILHEIIHKEFILGAGCRMVVSKHYRTYEFVENTKYRTLEGHATHIKNGERVSGDTYTMLQLENGQMIMSLSDGMGSGEMARKESDYIIQMIEALLDSGFEKKQTVRLVNSLMFLKSDQKTYSTVDISLINLYTGKCEFIKVGAVASYVQKNDGTVQRFMSASLPIGTFTDVDYSSETTILEDGDRVIMVSDGIVNGCDSQWKNVEMDGEIEDDPLKEFIENKKIQAPQEMADAILEYALSGEKDGNTDDMTVLVCDISNMR